MSVRFGLALDFVSARRSTREQLRRQLVLVRLAARYDFESIWIGESYAQQPDAPGAFHPPSSLVVAAAVAQHTRLRIGTGVLLLPALHPLKLAYDAALLDQISGGRFILGVGVARAPLQRRFGVDPGQVACRADHTLAALRALWSGASGYASECLSIDGGIAPLPTRPGGLPLWVGGALARSAERAARFGDGYYASTSYTFEQVARQSERYRQALERNGPDQAPPVVAANRLTVVAPTAAEARRLAERHAGSVLRAYAVMGSLGAELQAAVPAATELFERLDDQMCLVGAPEDVTARVRRYAEAGVTHIQARVSPDGLPLARAVQTVRLLGERILPQFSVQEGRAPR